VTTSSAGRTPSRGLAGLGAWRYFESRSPGKLSVLLLFGLAAAAQSLLLLPVLLLIRHAVDTVIPQRQFGLLIQIGAAIFALRAAGALAALWLRAAHVRVLKQATFRLREDLLARLFSLSRAAYTRLDRDTTHARIVLDTERLDEMTHAVVARLLPAFFSALVLLVLLAFLNTRLLLLTLALAPLLLLSIRATGGLVKRRVIVFQRAFEAFSNGVLFVLQHMELALVQAFESREAQRRVADMDRLRRSSERMAFVYAVHGQLQTITVTLCGVVILVAGGAAVAAGHMTIGGFLSFWVAAGLLNQQVTAIVTAIPQVIAGNESMQTLHRFAMSCEPLVYGGREVIPFAGRIRLDEVEFGYGGAPVVRGASLEIGPGETAAIAGPNGAGKSTLLYLMLGFYRPQRGTLSADGVPYDRLDLVELRRRIGVVMQHPTFFAGTVRENIAYGWPEATMEEIAHAARIAQADEFIRALPQGYDTPIGEGGMLLSGGEVQRIAIARALLRRPRLLILDEPTNHLEGAAVRRLLDSLAGLEERPGVLIISHDREVLRYVDRVHTIAGGILAPPNERLEPRARIVALGTR
jgi:ABC-type multidrug transport system fused ATPase/permease subunit